MTKLSGSLPKGDGNGLDALNAALIDNAAKGTFIMLAIVDCKTITTDVDSGAAEATARIRRIEAVPLDDKDRAVQMLVRAQDVRLGKTVLPIELEDELKELLDGLDVDLKTGEIKDKE